MYIDGIEVDLKSGNNLQKIIFSGRMLGLTEEIQLKQLNFDIHVNDNRDYVQVMYLPQFDDKQTLPILNNMIKKLRDKGQNIYRSDKTFIRVITKEKDYYLGLNQN